MHIEADHLVRSIEHHAALIAAMGLLCLHALADERFVVGAVEQVIVEPFADEGMNTYSNYCDNEQSRAQPVHPLYAG